MLASLSEILHFVSNREIVYKTFASFEKYDNEWLILDSIKLHIWWRICWSSTESLGYKRDLGLAKQCRYKLTRKFG